MPEPRPRRPCPPSLWALLGSAAALTLAACALGPDEVLPPVPPGQPLAYISFGIGGRHDIFLLSADARTDENLTLHSAYDFWPSWSPDGSQLAFESNRDDSLRTEVYVLTVATSSLVRLTDDTGFADANPAWSPRGNRIAFATDRDSSGLEIYLMDPDGANLKRLTTAAGNSAHPAWSPTGDRLAFASDRTGSLDIYVMDTLGGNVVNLTNSSAADLAPAWSPDGSKIALQSARDPAGFAIWVMDATGANPMKISPSDPPCELPHWAPDGLRIAFDCDGDIYVASPSGGSRIRITRTSNQQRLEVMPRWRPTP
jgi:TolB protein